MQASSKKISRGDIREGVIVSIKGKRFVDVGADRLIQHYGSTPVGKRVTVQFKEGHPKLSLKEIGRDEVASYWGYTVKERANLYSLLSEWGGDIIMTSRKGKTATSEQLSKYSKSENVLVVFGSPERGVQDIIGGRINKVQNSRLLNFFPNQATETVRLEEALLGTLAIINSQRTL